jgi:hypothetical protein
VIRRTAALFGMLAFALSWMVGVWCGHSPQVRLQAALIGLLAGAIAGACIGVALQKIVLARLAEQWRQLEAAAASEKSVQPASGARVAGKPAAAAPPATPGDKAGALPGKAGVPAAAREMAEATR